MSSGGSFLRWLPLAALGLYAPSPSTPLRASPGDRAPRAGVPRGQTATPFALYAPSGVPRGQGAKGGAHPGCTRRGARRGEGGVLVCRALRSHVRAALCLRQLLTHGDPRRMSVQPLHAGRGSRIPSLLQSLGHRQQRVQELLIYTVFGLIDAPEGSGR